MGFEYAGRGPARHHRATLPAFDPASDLAHPAEQVLDQFGGGQHPFEIFGQPQTHHGQSFLQSFARRGVGARMLMFKPARWVVEQAPGCVASRVA